MVQQTKVPGVREAARMAQRSNKKAVLQSDWIPVGEVEIKIDEGENNVDLAEWTRQEDE